MPLADAYARLRAMPGIGPWTAAEVARPGARRPRRGERRRLPPAEPRRVRAGRRAQGDRRADARAARAVPRPPRPRDPAARGERDPAGGARAADAAALDRGDLTRGRAAIAREHEARVLRRTRAPRAIGRGGRGSGAIDAGGVGVRAGGDLRRPSRPGSDPDGRGSNRRAAAKPRRATCAVRPERRDRDRDRIRLGVVAEGDVADAGPVADERPDAAARARRADVERDVVAVDAGADDDEGDRPVGLPVERVGRTGGRVAEAGDRDRQAAVGVGAVRRASRPRCASGGGRAGRRGGGDGSCRRSGRSVRSIEVCLRLRRDGRPAVSSWPQSCRWRFWWP